MCTKILAKSEKATCEIIRNHTKIIAYKVLIQSKDGLQSPWHVANWKIGTIQDSGLNANIFHSATHLQLSNSEVYYGIHCLLTRDMARKYKKQHLPITGKIYKVEIDTKHIIVIGATNSSGFENDLNTVVATKVKLLEKIR